jgi:hypothetical protein
MSRHRLDRRRPSHAERRSQRRVAAVHVPDLSAHLSGGARVALLDVSQGGVRLETTRHMRPGQRVSIRFSVDDRVVVITAAVVRAAVVHVHPEEVPYETGLQLSEDLACDGLELALLDRRTEDTATDPDDVGTLTVPDGPATDLFFVPADGVEGEDAPGGRRWWLASRRRRTLFDQTTVSQESAGPSPGAAS